MYYELLVKVYFIKVARFGFGKLSKSWRICTSVLIIKGCHF